MVSETVMNSGDGSHSSIKLSSSHAGTYTSRVMMRGVTETMFTDVTVRSKP